MKQNDYVLQKKYVSELEDNLDVEKKKLFDIEMENRAEEAMMFFKILNSSSIINSNGEEVSGYDYVRSEILHELNTTWYTFLNLIQVCGQQRRAR